MEWVETTGKSVDEARNCALDQLGVAEDDAEVVVVDEPRAGLFGRMRGEARVRARVRPTTPRPKLDRRDRNKHDGRGRPVDDPPPQDRGGDDVVPAGEVAPGEMHAGAAPASERQGRRGGRGRNVPRAGGDDHAGGATDRSDGSDGVEELPVSASAHEHGSNKAMVDAATVGEQARVFVQGVVDAFGLTGTTGVHQDGDDLEVVVDGRDLGLLVGPRGVTLQALQDLARVAAQRRLGDHDTRLRVDVGGYRERRREALARFVRQVAEQVIAEGVSKRLEPMSSSDRKVVHDELAGVAGVVTRSEGEDPQRCVVIAPSAG